MQQGANHHYKSTVHQGKGNDMGKWIEQLVVFFDELKETFGTSDSGVYLREDNFIGKPLGERELERLRSEFGNVPESLVDFFRSETASISYVYCVNNPYFHGGLSMNVFASDNPFRHLFTVRELGVFFDELPVNPNRRELALNSATILDTGGGDFLLVDVRDGDDPPVYFIGSEEDRMSDLQPPIACSFSSFLRDWSRLCYIGPDYFIYGDTFSLLDSNGQLNACPENVQRLREVLGLTKEL